MIGEVKLKKLIIITLTLAALLTSCGGKEDEKRSPYPEVELDGNFIIADDSEIDIENDKDYLALDRNLYFKNGGLEFTVTADDEDLDEGAAFFLEYFDAVLRGDEDRYNSMFSEAYFASYLPQAEFTKQMIYDMHIELISREESGETLNLTYYVDYKIHRNNGTFRRDILHDASRKLCFILSGTKDNLKIDSITY